MAAQTSSISNFKKFCVRILLPLLLMVMVAGYLFQIVFEKKVILNSEINGSYKVNRIITSTNTAEIPIFGSSRAEGSFVPGMLGPEYFDYGLSGTRDDVLLFFLTEECKKNKSTPIIINFDMEGLDSSIGDLSYYIYNASYKPVRDLLGSNYKTYFGVPFFKYYGYYEYYTKNWLTGKISLTKKTDHGASLELNKITDKKFSELVEQRSATVEKFSNDKALQQAFENLINTHKNRRFIIVVSPYHSSYFTRYQNLNEAQAYLKSLDNLENVKVIDFSHVNYPDSLFMNTTHVNYAGAIRVTQQLKDSLLKP